MSGSAVLNQFNCVWPNRVVQFGRCMTTMDDYVGPQAENDSCIDIP
jgi:hypothetical protein